MKNSSSKNDDWEQKREKEEDGKYLCDKKYEEMKEREETSKAEAKDSEGILKRELKDREEMSKAFQAIAQVRDEVSALEVAVNCGTKVANEEFVVPSELLMRQLLKLDTIEAEGEAKMQRKAEVRRIQNFHEVLDDLKSSNSKPFGNNSDAVSVRTEWLSIDSSVESSSPPPISPST
ncbi:BAG family molecular chaperone regulator 4 isoform X2 [Ricinus communis]|uniref:BAG family molecular chaperone regulator 4 isoform X2 n=1 Tax=Ricinus communis TaxID=3988 RepID=UPI00077264A8|nr:BAG family molecular chaperone regulator 4 isoform X2 [Ricinus communis]|eukprot:XP_015581670.1 BAG family molecular chaperone regulator 4 isoform X2 [Ricinus communis]